MYGKGLWENCEYQFPRISPYNGFCCILLCYRKLMEIPMYFPCDEVYHWWKSNEKKAPNLRKSMSNNFSGFPLQWVLLRFPALWESDGEIYAFFIRWSIGQDENLMEKSTRTMEKRMWINFLGFPHSMGFATISHAIGNWWGNSCISYLMEHTKRWESNGKKAPVLGVLQNVVHFGKKKFPNFERKMFILSLRSFSPSNSR